MLFDSVDDTLEQHPLFSLALVCDDSLSDEESGCSPPRGGEEPRRKRTEQQSKKPATAGDQAAVWFTDALIENHSLDSAEETKPFEERTIVKLSNIRLCLTLLMLNITIPAAKAVTMTDFKTFYTVSIEARNVPYEFFVNDIPVFDKTDEASSINSKIPINPWLINGRNTFKIRLLPVKVSTADPRDPKFCKVVISGPKDKGMPNTALAQAEVNPLNPSKDESFTVTLGYPMPAWAQSKKIGKDATTQKKILDKYREFHRFLEKKDLDGIVKFSAAKFKEYSKSMYDPDFESNAKNSLKEEFANPSNKLIGIDVQEKNGLRYEYYYGDRLVRIKNDEDRSIIQYYDADEGVTTEYPLFFYFDGKDFVLIL